jgi:hypothetical protein
MYEKERPGVIGSLKAGNNNQPPLHETADEAVITRTTVARLDTVGVSNKPSPQQPWQKRSSSWWYMWTSIGREYVTYASIAALVSLGQ